MLEVGRWYEAETRRQGRGHTLGPPDVHRWKALLTLLEQQLAAMDMADATPMKLAPSILLEMKDLLVASFGTVWDESLMPGCFSECFSGSDGRLYPYAFNDIDSTTRRREGAIGGRARRAGRSSL